MSPADLIIAAFVLGCALIALRVIEASEAGKKEEKDDDDQDPPLPPATV